MVTNEKINFVMNTQTIWKKFTVFTKINKKLTFCSYYVHNYMLQFVICKEMHKKISCNTE